MSHNSDDFPVATNAKLLKYNNLKAKLSLQNSGTVNALQSIG